jgi:ABC-type multidrug transport system permease subunit
MNQFECSAAPPLPPQATMMDGTLHTVRDEPVGSTADLAMISLVLGLCSGFYVGSVLAIIFGHVMKWGILASVLWLVVSFVVAVVVGVVVVRSKLRGVTCDEQVRT